MEAGPAAAAIDLRRQLENLSFANRSGGSDRNHRGVGARWGAHWHGVNLNIPQLRCSFEGISTCGGEAVAQEDDARGAVGRHKRRGKLQGRGQIGRILLRGGSRLPGTPSESLHDQGLAREHDLRDAFGMIR